MSMNALASNFRAKTDSLPLHWWKLLMICKALLAPAIGALIMAVTWHFRPDTSMDLSQTSSRVIILTICTITSVAAAFSVLMWRIRKINEPMNFIAILVSGMTGALACTMIFAIATAH